MVSISQSEEVSSSRSHGFPSIIEGVSRIPVLNFGWSILANSGDRQLHTPQVLGISLSERRSVDDPPTVGMTPIMSESQLAPSLAGREKTETMVVPHSYQFFFGSF